MKRNRNKVLLIALCLVLIGGAISFTAWAMGANTSGLYWDGGFRVHGSGNWHELNESLDSFSHVDIRVGVYNVSIQTGNDYRISGYVRNDLRVSVDGDTLIVSEPTGRRRGFNINFGFFGRNSDNGALTITVPTNTVLGSLLLELGVGQLNLRDIEALSADISNGVGDIRTSGVTLADAQISSGVGNIHLDGTLQGNNEFSSGTGNVNLTLTGYQSDFSINFQTGVGNSSMDGAAQRGGSRSGQHPSGHLDISSGVGNIRVTFRGD